MTVSSSFAVFGRKRASEATKDNSVQPLHLNRIRGSEYSTPVEEIKSICSSLLSFSWTKMESRHQLAWRVRFICCIRHAQFGPAVCLQSKALAAHLLGPSVLWTHGLTRHRSICVHCLLCWHTSQGAIVSLKTVSTYCHICYKFLTVPL